MHGWGFRAVLHLLVNCGLWICLCVIEFGGLTHGEGEGTHGVRREILYRVYLSPYTVSSVKHSFPVLIR